MPISTTLVAKQLLMCGLKHLPVVGTAVEVIEGICARHEQMAVEGRVDAVEAQMTRLERTVRDAVEKEIRAALTNLSRSNLDGPALTAEIRELQGIRAQGWEPTLFDGLLANSSHWQELHRHPGHYGHVLSDSDPVNRDKIHLVIEADRPRLLELPPYAFSSLLAGEPVGVPEADIVSARDIWARPRVRSPSLGDHLPQFTRWPETPGVMNGASRLLIRLNRRKETDDADWAVLEPLRFWLVNRGTNTHTFGYIRSELPALLRPPLGRWIAAAKGRAKGSEARVTKAGEVVRVNVKSNSITILGDVGGEVVV